MDVRHGGSEPVLIAHLIVHHGITNVFDQTTQFIRILDVVEKALNLPLICQWLEFLENVFQFPDDPCLSGLALDLGGERSLLFQLLSPFSFLGIALRNRCAERGSKGP
jgi:hypothetical protein